MYSSKSIANAWDLAVAFDATNLQVKLMGYIFFNTLFTFAVFVQMQKETSQICGG
jgi:hypothetical protein